MNRFMCMNAKLLPVLLAAVILTLMSSPALAAVLTCNDCSNCNSQIQAAQPGDIVQLTAGINDQVGNCILFGGKDDVTFDCIGNTIDGYIWYSGNGIWLDSSSGGSNNNIIRNCTVTNFANGVYIVSSSNNTIINVTSNFNSVYGFYIATSSDNNLRNITAKENAYYDFYVTATSTSHCSNYMSDVMGSGNRPIKYFNYSVNLHDETLSELIFCNADNSNITNIKIDGSNGNNNNGMLAILTDYSNFTNINSSKNFWGAEFSSSSNNILKNITATFNSGGIVFSSSSYNIFTDSVVNSNFWAGLVLDSGSNSNVLSNITVSYNNPYGLSIQYSLNNIIVNVTGMENNIDDFFVSVADPSHCNNIILNFTGSGNKEIKYFNYSVNLHDETLSELIFCNADNSNITNITIIGSASKKNNGLYVISTDYSNFTDINSSYRNSGLYIASNTNNIFTNITLNNNYYSGLSCLYYSRDSNFTNVVANYNGNNGISLDSCYRNNFKNVNASSNSINGFTLGNAYNNTFTNITASYNLVNGTYFSGFSYSNAITSSRIEKNANSGVYFEAITLTYPPWVSYPSYNMFYNNILNNTVNLRSNNDGNQNYWNTALSCTAGPNIIGGVPIAGNYWATPAGTGFSNNCIDTNNKGICDSSYTPVTNNTDYLPLHIPGPDTTPPDIIFIPPTPQNNTKVSTDYIQVNISILKTTNSCLDETPNSCLLNWYNGVSWANYTMAKSGYSCYFNVTGLLPNIVYQYRVYANDTAGNMNVSETRQNSASDFAPPSITFVPPTPLNAVVVYSNYIEVNASISEAAGTCILDWWYGGAWTNYSMMLDPSSLSCYINMTDLPNGLYIFRVYANDTAGNMNVSETRQNPVSYVGSAIILTKFSVGMVHLEVGKSGKVKAYINNPDSQFANISVWLGGDYPMGLLKFSNQPPQMGVYLTTDMRNATIGLNPKEQRVLDLIIYSTGPGLYVINITANTTASSKKDFDSINLFIDYPPSFPGLEPWGILLILNAAGLIYWKIRK